MIPIDANFARLLVYLLAVSGHRRADQVRRIKRRRLFSTARTVAVEYLSHPARDRAIRVYVAEVPEFFPYPQSNDQIPEVVGNAAAILDPTSHPWTFLPLSYDNLDETGNRAQANS